MKFIKLSGLCAALLTLFSCNDKIDVQQAYDFGITTWYLQKTIKPGKTVEIRFYLTREGFYADAEFSIGYVQIEGEGIVYDTLNTRLVNREFCALDCRPAGRGFHALLPQHVGQKFNAEIYRHG